MSNKNYHFLHPERKVQVYRNISKITGILLKYNLPMLDIFLYTEMLLVTTHKANKNYMHTQSVTNVLLQGFILGPVVVPLVFT